MGIDFIKEDHSAEGPSTLESVRDRIAEMGDDEFIIVVPLGGKQYAET